MSYLSDISGLELFQMPFSHHNARQPQATGYQDTRRRQPVEAAKATQQQSGQQTAVQQTGIQKPEAQAVKPAVSAVKNADIIHNNASENACTMPEAGTKAAAQVPSGKTQADVPEKQPASELIQKAQTASKPQAPADTQEQPETKPKELVLDMSSGTGTVSSDKSGNADDTAKRKAHEATEAKRKAEWEAAQQAKKRAEAEAVLKLQNMSDADIIAVSTNRISLDVERLTRRNMKECVSEHIQDLCRKDPAFARLTMHPKKSMINCFRYINRKAKEFVEQEMKDNDTKPENGIYGCDVPDGIVLGWSEEYMRDADAPENQEKEEKFTPKPYINTQPKTKSAASKTKKPAKTKKKEEKQTESGNYEQMSFV